MTTYNKAYMRQELLNSRGYLIGVSPLDLMFINSQLDSLNRGFDPVRVARNLLDKFPPGLAEGHVKSILTSSIVEPGIKVTDSIPRSPDIQAASRKFATAVRPFWPAIDLLPMPADAKRAFKNDPLSYVWNFVQYFKDRIVDLINRVNRRSGKTRRTVGGKTFDMRATKSTPTAIVAAQLLILVGTDWWALHDEMFRMAIGQPVGQKGPLGAFLGEYEYVGEAATATAAATGGISVGGFFISLDALGIVATITGALVPVALALIAWGSQATAPKPPPPPPRKPAPSSTAASGQKSNLPFNTAAMQAAAGRQAAGRPTATATAAESEGMGTTLALLGLIGVGAFILLKDKR